MDELEPCPFCGRKVNIHRMGFLEKSFFIAHVCVWSETSHLSIEVTGSNRQEVIEAWNRRVDNFDS